MAARPTDGGEAPAYDAARCHDVSWKRVPRAELWRPGRFAWASRQSLSIKGLRIALITRARKRQLHCALHFSR